MSLPKHRKEELSHALLDAYRSASELEQLMAYKLGESLWEHIGPGPLRQMVLDLIKWAEANNRINALVEGAYQSRRGNQRLRAFHDRHFADAQPASGDSDQPVPEVRETARRMRWTKLIAGGSAMACVLLGGMWLVSQPRAGSAGPTSAQEGETRGVEPGAGRAAQQPSVTAPAPGNPVLPPEGKRVLTQEKRPQHRAAGQVQRGLDGTGSKKNPPQLASASSQVRAPIQAEAAPELTSPVPLSDLPRPAEENRAPQAVRARTEHSLTAETKGRIPIFVFSSGIDPSNTEVVEAVRGLLQSAGYSIARRRDEAALLLDISVLLDKPVNDFSGMVSTWHVAARLSMRVTWADDHSPLFVESVDSAAEAGDLRNARLQAVRSGLTIILQKFNALVNRD